jgi:hypothetical protein
MLTNRSEGTKLLLNEAGAVGVTGRQRFDTLRTVSRAPVRRLDRALASVFGYAGLERWIADRLGCAVGRLVLVAGQLRDCPGVVLLRRELRFTVTHLQHRYGFQP